VGRSNKQTADYFPHYVGRQSVTRFILEKNWGNNGYAFWFKLLELLCSRDGHYYDCWPAASWDYPLENTSVPAEMAEEILRTLADSGKIDRELWDYCRVIWVPSLIRNLQDLYSKRTTVPQRPQPSAFPNRNAPPEEPTPAEEPPPAPAHAPEPPEAPQPPEPPKSRRKNTGTLSAAQQALFEKFYEAYPKKVDPATAERAWAKITPEPDEAMTQKIIEAVEAAKKYDSRFRDRQYIPNPASWLNAKGYLSDYTSGGEQHGESGGHHSQTDPGAFKPSGGFRGGET